MVNTCIIYVGKYYSQNGATTRDSPAVLINIYFGNIKHNIIIVSNDHRLGVSHTHRVRALSLVVVYNYFKHGVSHKKQSYTTGARLLVRSNVPKPHAREISKLKIIISAGKKKKKILRIVMRLFDTQATL